MALHQSVKSWIVVAMISGLLGGRLQGCDFVEI